MENESQDRKGESDHGPGADRHRPHPRGGPYVRKAVSFAPRRDGQRGQGQLGMRGACGAVRGCF